MIEPDAYELNNIWEEHNKVADEIYDFVHNPPAVIPRVNNMMVCKGCFFKELCRYELKGMNTDILLEEGFEPSDYDALIDGPDKAESAISI
jgi:hypothetical protein